MDNKNVPFVFYNSKDFEDLGGGVKRKVLAYGDALMQVEVHFEEGSEEAIPQIGFADRCGNIKRTVDLPYYCNHYHASKDNTLLVADAVNDLVLIDISKDTPSFEVLCEHNTSWLSHNVHCHPTWSWNNDKILFASDRDRQGYAQMYMINIK